MKNFMKTIKYITVLILALSFVGCEDDDDVLQVFHTMDMSE